MVIKKNDIVVLTVKPRVVSLSKSKMWTFGHKKGTVGRVSHVRKGPYPYIVTFLSNYVGSMAPFCADEIKLAPPKVKRKYTKAYIEKLYGACLKKGCNYSCPHN